MDSFLAPVRRNGDARERAQRVADLLTLMANFLQALPGLLDLVERTPNRQARARTLRRISQEATKAAPDLRDVAAVLQHAELVLSGERLEEPPAWH